MHHFGEAFLTRAAPARPPAVASAVP